MPIIRSDVPRHAAATPMPVPRNRAGIASVSAVTALMLILAGCGGNASSTKDGDSTATAGTSSVDGTTGITGTNGTAGTAGTTANNGTAATGATSSTATPGSPAATPDVSTGATTGNSTAPATGASDPATGANTAATVPMPAPPVVGDTDSNPNTSVPPVTGVSTAYTYEAENNFISGGVSVSNGSAVQGFSATGARLIFTVNASAAGAQQLNLRYANASTTANTLNLYVNGVYTATTSLAPTGGSTTWGSTADTVTLRAGLNTISYQRDAGTTGQVAIDSLKVPGGIALATRGATLPYVEYEAESGTSNVAADAASTAYLTPSAESSGRQSRTLSSTGHYVEWVATKPANSLMLRYSMADAAQGGGTSNTLSLYINGTKVRSLDLSSRFAWVYGAYPFNNNPADGQAHRFYDESSVTGLSIPKGATVRLQKDSTDSASYYKIDLVDLEQADSAYAMPANFVSVTSYGAVADDGVDDSAAINSAITDAKSKGKNVWIPAGTFTVASRISVAGVQVRGAGMWHTTLQGVNGKGGFLGTGSGVTVADLTVRGDSTVRNDSDDHCAFEGSFGSGSLIQNVWVEHTKVGLWLGSTNGLYMVGGRIRDTWADGVNLAGGVSNTTISQFNLRNTGDDAMAMWSNGNANVNNSFRFNTAQLPILANTFAIYGGQDNKILDNIGADTVTSSAGIAISNRFSPVAFSGTTEVRRNTLNRTGGYDGGFSSPIGALYIYVDAVDNNGPIVVDTLEANDSTYEGMQVSYGAKVASLSLNNVQFKNAGTYGMRFNNVTGTGNFSGVTVSGTKSAALSNPSDRYTINRGANNSGW